MSSISFNNVSLLGISQQSVKLETDFIFKRQQSISISGLLIDLDNQEGIKDIFEEGNDFFNLPSLGSITGSLPVRINELIINGKNLGDGWVDSFEVFGDHIQTAYYSASLRINKGGNFASSELVQNESSNLSISSSGLTADDFNYLNSLDEAFDFSVNADKSINISHDISCSFGYKKSIIEENNKFWVSSGVSSISNSRFKNLNNRGKGSLAISANKILGKTVNLQAGDYSLFYDFLGQNIADKNSWKNNSFIRIRLGGTSGAILAEKHCDIYQIDHAEIKFSVASTSNVLFQIVTGSRTNYYDNISLHKTEDLPINKSRKLARFLVDNNPNYSLISGYSGEYKKLSSNENSEETESYDDLNLSYSLSRDTNYKETTSASGVNYSFEKETSFDYQEDGFVSISEKISIILLSSKNLNNLKTAINAEVAKSYTNSKNLIESYKEYFRHSCAGFGFSGDIGPDFDPSIQQDLNGDDLFIKPVAVSSRANEKDGKAEISIVYSNNLGFNKDVSSTHFWFENYTVSVDYNLGNKDVIISGNIEGYGESEDDRNDAAEHAFNQFKNSTSINNILNNNKDLLEVTSIEKDDYERYVLQHTDLDAFYFTNIHPDQTMEDWGKVHWTNHGSSEPGRTLPKSPVFRKVSENFNFEDTGKASFTLNYSDSESFNDAVNETSSSAIDAKIKNFEISVSEGETTEIFSDFVINCQNWAQDLNKLLNPKSLVVSISVFGFENQEMGELYLAAERILKKKALYRGEDSESSNSGVVDASSYSEYLISQGVTYSEKENRLTYQRTTLDLSSCDSTAQIDETFGFGDWQSNYVTVAPTLYEYQDPTFTFTTVSWPENEWPDYPFTPTPLPTNDIDTDVCIAYIGCGDNEFSYHKVSNTHEIDGYNSFTNLYLSQTFFDINQPEGERCINVSWLPEYSCPAGVPNDDGFGVDLKKSDLNCNSPECQAAAPTGESSFSINSFEANESQENVQEEMVYTDIFLPIGWSGTIRSLLDGVDNYELISGQRCMEFGILNNIENLSNSNLESKTCGCQTENLDGLSSWESFKIYLPEKQLSVLDQNLINKNEVVSVEVPHFWDKTLQEIFPDASLVAIENENMEIQYNINGSINPNNQLILKNENNESHPNFYSENKIICGSKVYFRPNNLESKPNTENIYRCELPFIEGRSNGGEGLEYLHEWIQRCIEQNLVLPQYSGCFELVGWEDCYNKKYFNLSDYKINEDNILEHCNVLGCEEFSEEIDCGKIMKVQTIYLKINNSDKCNWDGSLKDIINSVIY